MQKEMPLVSELMQRLGDSNVFGDREALVVSWAVALILLWELASVTMAASTSTIAAWITMPTVVQRAKPHLTLLLYRVPVENLVVVPTVVDAMVWPTAIFVTVLHPALIMGTAATITSTTASMVMAGTVEDGVMVMAMNAMATEQMETAMARMTATKEVTMEMEMLSSIITTITTSTTITTAVTMAKRATLTMAAPTTRTLVTGVLGDSMTLALGAKTTPRRSLPPLQKPPKPPALHLQKPPSSMRRPLQ
mmetsp:Transcript_58395/g.92448  ORF Transcript_58395/g.92448 Transcript_58395/m.92448 type:complete len:250 (-) Transcript_58395:1684-2433(-)